MWDQEPCNDYSSGNAADTVLSDQEESEGNETQAIEETKEPESQAESSDVSVWISATGKKYHSIPNCGTMNPDNATQVIKEQAESRGLSRCSKCL